MRALIVGEAWGRTEDELKHPFVGESGLELARMLHQIDLGPPLRDRWVEPKGMVRHWARLKSDFDIGLTNVFNARPPGNDVSFFFDREGDSNFPPFRVGAKRGWLKSEFLDHVLRFYDEVEAAKPNVIIAMGNTACWATIGETKITALRGTVHRGVAVTPKVLPTYHPALILRQWSFRVVTLADLDKARRESEFAEVRRPKRWLTIPEPTAAGIGEATPWFIPGGEQYAVDIETRIGQISIVGFARSAADALVIPFMNDDGSSYWPTPELEVQAWRLVRAGLMSVVPKTFQNGIYDISYFLRMGLVPKACVDDTMLRHHSMFPELPKALGFLGSLYTDAPAWKFMRKGEATKRDD